MRTVRTAIAAILASLAFVAFESAADAQARRGGTGSSSGTSRSTSVTRTRPGSSKSESNDRKPSTTVTRPASERPAAVRPSAQSDHSVRTRPSRQTRPSAQEKPSSQVRPSEQVRPSGVSRPSQPAGQKPSDRPSVRPGSRPSDRPSVRPDAGGGHRPDRPVQVRPVRKQEPPKVHPHHRDFIAYDRPSHFWTRSHHYYGHRVKMLPSHVRRHVYHGVTYYCYNDIWYRPFGGYYVVCRPPFGTVLAANLIADIAWTAVRLSYYNTVARTYDKISENNAYIAQQNAVIAQNNAEIAAQNQTIAMNQQLASQAYDLAESLGLIQSYAAAGSTYYYQDGIFYTMDARGDYQVIVPPAGAMVETLPEDFEMVTLGGNEYYKVDDTIYRVVINEGKPYFEVLGQIYS